MSDPIHSAHARAGKLTPHQEEMLETTNDVWGTGDGNNVADNLAIGGIALGFKLLKYIGVTILFGLGLGLIRLVLGV